MGENKYWAIRWGMLLACGVSTNALLLSPLFRHPLPVAGVGLAGTVLTITYLWRTSLE